MLDYLRYKRQTHKIIKEISNNDKFYGKKIEEEKKKCTTKDEIGKLYAEWRGVNDGPETELKVAMTRYLTAKATKYNVPIPEKSNEELWEDYFGYQFLTEKGHFELNKTIRQELKERLEIWIPIITALTGLIGVFIGLISILAR